MLWRFEPIISVSKLSPEKTINLNFTGAASVMAVLAIASSSFAGDNGCPQHSFQGAVQQMPNKDGMIARQDFMAVVSTFDSMDKSKRGMLSQADLMRIFRDNTGQ